MSKRCVATCLSAPQPGLAAAGFTVLGVTGNVFVAPERNLADGFDALRYSDLKADALTRYLRDPELASQHGSAGQQRVLREFTPERIWEQTLSCYEGLLAEVKGTLGTVTERLQEILRTVRRDPEQTHREQLDLNALVKSTADAWRTPRARAR